MSLQKIKLHLSVSRLCALCLAVAISLPGNPSGFWSPASMGPLAPNTTFTVNTTLDTPDIEPANGICLDPGGKCSLRAGDHGG